MARDSADMDVDVPAVLALAIPPAGEFGHAPHDCAGWGGRGSR